MHYIRNTITSYSLIMDNDRSNYLIHESRYIFNFKIFNVKIRFTSLLTVVPFILFSCGLKPCEDKNKVFSQFAPDSHEYQTELVTQMQMPSNHNLGFRFDRYESRNNKEYIFVDIRGENLCAKGMLLVEDWSSIKEIQRTKGEGYHGAELLGINILFRVGEGKKELVFIDVVDIVD